MTKEEKIILKDLRDCILQMEELIEKLMEEETFVSVSRTIGKVEIQKVPTMEITEETFEETATQLIRDLGIPAKLLGSIYIKEAAFLVLQDKTYLRAMTKRLYPDIAKIHKSTPGRVERAIRHAIEVAWARGSIEKIHEIFAYTVTHQKGRPTNLDFIAIFTEEVEMEIKRRSK